MTASNGYLEHQTVAGERWDIIAFRYYEDVGRQDELIAANRLLFVGERPQKLPYILPAGLTLRIPILEEKVSEDALPPWKRSTADYGDGGSAP